MKKHLAFLLTLTLIMMSFASFAEVDANNVGKELQALGIIKGDADGNLHTGENVTREEALTTVLRMRGLDKAAQATTVNPSFIDVPVDHWARPAIAYAQINNITTGIGNGMYGLGYKVTTQQYVTFVLRALGYNSPTIYDQAMVKGTQIGLLKDVKATGDTDTITRADVFVIMHNALYTKPMGEDTELIYKLGLKEKPAAETPAEETTTATETTTVEPTTEEPKESKFDKIEDNGLKQLKVYFTAPIKSAGDSSNYDLDTGGRAKLGKDASFVLSEDRKVITITLSEAAFNQEELKLTIEDIIDKDIEEEFEIFDDDIPTIKQAEVVGKKTIKVTFSELMDKGLTGKANYSVETSDGTRLYVSKVESAANGMSALVQLYSDIEQDTKIKIQDVKDFAGYKVISKSFTLDYEEDKDAPEVKAFKNANLNTVTLVFDEDIKFNGDLKKVYHTNKSNRAKEVTINGNEMKIKFPKGSEMPSGTTYLYIEDEAIEDFWGNENDNKLRFEIEVTSDDNGPMLKGKVDIVDQDEIKLKFDENIEKDGDFELTLYKNGKRKRIDMSSSIDDDTLTIKFDEDLTGKYELKIEGLEDEFGNESKTFKVEFDVDDKTAPTGKKFKATAYDINEDIQIIVIDFGDRMDEKDIEDEDNYQLDGKDLDDLDVEIKAQDGDTQVRIELPEDEYDLKSSDLGKNNELLTIGRMSDAAGNKMSSYSVNVDIDNGDSETIAIKEVALVKRDMVKFTVDDRLSSVTNEQFVVMVDNEEARVTDYQVDINADGETEIMLTLKHEYSTDPKKDDMSYVIRTEKDLDKDDLEPSVNRYDQKIEEEDGKIVDKCAPEVEKVEFLSDKLIYVYFTEKLDSGYVSIKGLNGFSVVGGKAKDATLHATDGTKILITGEDFTVNSDVVYEDSNIYDLKGNELADFEHTSRLSEDE